MAGRANSGVQAMGAGEAAAGKRECVPCGGRRGASQSVHGGRNRYWLSGGAGRGGVHFAERPRQGTAGPTPGTKHALVAATNDASFSAARLLALGRSAKCGYAGNTQRNHPRRVDAPIVERAATPTSARFAGAAWSSVGLDQRTTLSCWTQERALP